MKLSLSTTLAAVLLFGANYSALAHHIAGVIDSQGREVIPCKYRTVDYLGGGLFFVEELNEDQPLARTFTGMVIDGEGKTVSVSLPSGFTLSRVFLSKPEQFQKNKRKCRTLPLGTIFEVHGKDGVGLSDMNGKVLLEPKFGHIESPRDGFFPIFTGDGITDNRYEFTFNSLTGERKKGPTDCAPNGFNSLEVSKDDLRPFAVSGDDAYLWGYMNKAGDVAIEPKFNEAQHFTNEGLAVVEIRDLEKNHKYAYIDKSGRIVSPLYLSAQPFEDGLAEVVGEDATDSEQQLLDTKFKPVLKGAYRGGARKVFYDLYAIMNSEKPTIGYEARYFKAINQKGEFLFDFPGPLVSYPRRVGNHIECVAFAEAPGATDSRKILQVNRRGEVLKTESGPVVSNDFGIKVVSNKVANSELSYSLLNDKGESVSQVKDGYFKVVSKDLIVKGYSVPEFRSRDWVARNPSGHNRFELFGQFLRSYDLIGMSKKQVESLLGPPEKDEGRYYLLTGWCGFSWDAIDIEYDGEQKVQRWREVREGTPTHEPYWITSNMVWAGPVYGFLTEENDPVKRVRPKKLETGLSLPSKIQIRQTKITTKRR